MAKAERKREVLDRLLGFEFLTVHLCFATFENEPMLKEYINVIKNDTETIRKYIEEN